MMLLCLKGHTITRIVNMLEIGRGRRKSIKQNLCSRFATPYNASQPTILVLPHQRALVEAEGSPHEPEFARNSIYMCEWDIFDFISQTQ